MTTDVTVSPHRSVNALAGIIDGTDTDEVWERFTRELDEDRLKEASEVRGGDR